MLRNLRTSRRHELIDGDDSCDPQELASRAADAIKSYIRLPWAGTYDEQRLSRLRLALRLLKRIECLEKGRLR